VKTKLTLSIDDDVIQHAKRVAHTQGKSISALVESYLARLVLDESRTSFSARWKGRFKEAPRGNSSSFGLGERLR